MSLERLLDKTKEENGCWIWSAAIRSGYGAMKLEGKVISTHRYSYELHHGPIPEGMMICHTCDNPRCINPDHLFAGTGSDNMIDCLNKGRLVIPTGRQFDSNWRPENRFLTDDQVIIVKTRIRAGDQMAQIGRDMSIPYQTIRDIKGDRSYKHVSINH